MGLTLIRSLLSYSAYEHYPYLEEDELKAELLDLSFESALINLFSKGRLWLQAIYKAAAFTPFKWGNQNELKTIEENNSDLKDLQKNLIKASPLTTLPEVSEQSLILSDVARSVLYASLPSLVQGRKWLLLYSTARHGISLSTLYRRSMLWPGLTLLVVEDTRGAVFGGLVESPLIPTTNRKYEGSNKSFVFTNRQDHPVIYRPTGANRYFTLCSSELLAIGGGTNFALYLDSDLLSGSSSISETYGNCCLASSENFEVKRVEMWGFVYNSKFEDILALTKTVKPGIWRW